MLGALLGGWFLSPISEAAASRFNIASVMGAVIGAMVTIAIAKALGAT